MSQYGYGPEQSSTYVPGPSPLPRRRRGLLGIIIIFIVILLIIILLFFFPRPTATVTLTPVSHELSSVGTIGVPSHSLSSVQQGTETGIPTGSGVTGIPATGTLTFKNYTPVAVTIPAGTSVTNTTGQQIVTDTNVVVPPDPIIPGVASVSAHAAQVGESGNIPAMSVNGQCCSAVSSGILVFNETAFNGGRDEQKGPVVQQSDLDTIVNTLKTSLTQKALAGINVTAQTGRAIGQRDSSM